MPSTSKKQEKTMSAIAHDWEPPKSSKVADIPKTVAKDFHAADKKAHHLKGSKTVIQRLGEYAHPPKKKGRK
jgi:hypothetical protein